MSLPRRARFGLLALLALPPGGCKSTVAVNPPPDLGVPVLFGNRVTPTRDAAALRGGQHFVVGDNKGADTQLAGDYRVTTTRTRTAIDRYVARGIQNGRFVSRASVAYEGVLIGGMAFTDWIWLRGTFHPKPR